MTVALSNIDISETCKAGRIIVEKRLKVNLALKDIKYLNKLSDEFRLDLLLRASSLFYQGKIEFRRSTGLH